MASSQCGRNLTKLARFHSRIIVQSLLSYSPPGAALNVEVRYNHIFCLISLVTSTFLFIST